MDSKKIKIAMVTNHFGITGISRVILNYCEALDKKKYNLTVIAGKPIATENRDECKKNGINLIELPSRHNDAVRHYSGLLKLLKYNKYDIKSETRESKNTAYVASKDEAMFSAGSSDT